MNNELRRTSNKWPWFVHGVGPILAFDAGNPPKISLNIVGVPAEIRAGDFPMGSQ